MNFFYRQMVLAATIATFRIAVVADDGLVEPNAAPLYQKAFDLIDEIGKQERQWLRDPEARSGIAGQDWFRQVGESIDLLHEAAELPVCDWNYEEAEHTNYQARGRGALKLSRIVGWRYDGKSPEPNSVVRDQLAVLNLSHHLSRGGNAYDKITEIALDSIAIHNLSRHLHRMPPDVLNDLRRKLQSVPPPEDVCNILEAEFSSSLIRIKKELESGFVFVKEMELFPEVQTSFADDLRLGAIVRTKGQSTEEEELRIGLEERGTGASFVLEVGQKKRGIELESVDFDKDEAVLRRGEQAVVVRLKSREIVPVWPKEVHDLLEQMFGEEVARKIDSQEKLQDALLSLAESAHEEVQGIVDAADSKFPLISAEEDETHSVLSSTNIYAEIILSSLRNTFRQSALANTGQLLLDAAIDVSLHGEDALSDHSDPFADGPFTYEKTDKGFILRSEIEHHGEKLALRIGPLD